MLKKEEDKFNKQLKKKVSLLESLENSNSENDKKKEKKSFKNKTNAIILITLALFILGGIIFFIYKNKNIKMTNVNASYEEKRKNLINKNK